ncbi:hypothetical protein MVEN_00109200 [Mycena venus]|uniref:Uncharacterized protein n=1 Tax=Mycena venus TaxID=2733690 RepID=A0A8H7DIF0_9AGAR|nr:hypothetical protein MVEN_00109200 [Mycena venus]
MSKKRLTKRKPGDDSVEYRPGLSVKEKHELRRNASAAYYTWNPHLHEKNHVAMWKRRAEEKARQRQWDPPKCSKPMPPISPEAKENRDPHSSSVDLDGVSEMRVHGSIFSDDGFAAFNAQTDKRVLTESSVDNALMLSTPAVQEPMPAECLVIEVLAAMADRPTPHDGSPDHFQQLERRRGSTNGDSEGQEIHGGRLPSAVVQAAAGSVD